MTLEESIVSMLKEKQMTLTTAESCSGGLLAGRIMNVPGASSVYNEGYITYSNAAKENEPRIFFKKTGVFLGLL